jgi:hypothetical protein
MDKAVPTHALDDVLNRAERSIASTPTSVAAQTEPHKGQTQARQHFTGWLCCCLWCHFGFFYGMSPLVLPVADAFGEQHSVLGGMYLFGSGIMLALINVVSGASIFFLPLTPARWRFAAAVGVACWLVGVAIQALALWLLNIGLFLFSFVLLGFGMGVYNLFLHITLTRNFW